MIVLDTNIISELMRTNPAREVVNWLDAQASETVFITSVTVAEISYGLEALPAGKRYHALQSRFQRFVTQAFQERILNFNQEAAYSYGKLMAHRKRVGRPMSVPDGQIAAIALVRDMTLVTRNIKDFDCIELDLINPFSD